MEKISDLIRDGVAAMLDPMNEKSRAMLLPVVDAALAGIERRCPMSLLSTPGGTEIAYGPAGLEDYEFLLVAATPGGCMTAGVGELVKRPKGVDTPLDWGAIVHCTEETKVLPLLAVVTRRLGSDGIDTVNEKFAEYRKMGFTPTLLVLAVDLGDDACGLIGTLPLPARHETQIDAAQEAGTY